MTQAFLFERCGQRVYTDPLKTPEIEEFKQAVVARYYF